MLVLAFHHKQDLMSADERVCQCVHEAQREADSGLRRPGSCEDPAGSGPAAVLQMKHSSYDMKFTSVFGLK